MASILNFIACNIAIAAVNGAHNVKRGAKGIVQGAQDAAVALSEAKDAAAKGYAHAKTINDMADVSAGYVPATDFKVPAPKKARRATAKA